MCLTQVNGEPRKKHHTGKVGAGGAEGNSQPAGDAQGRQPEEEERHHRPGRNLDSG